MEGVKRSCASNLGNDWYTLRQVIAGMPAPLWKISSLNPWPESTPIFVVSASPWQISRGIADFLDDQGFPKTMVVTKIISDQRRDALFDQQQYKLDKITKIFQRLPTVRFVLIGDDGEKAPESFDALYRQYPDRILAMWIHAVSTDTERKRFPGQVLFREHPE